MKLLTKEEEDAHYRSVVKGGTVGGLIGLAGGVTGVLLASRRYYTIHNLTLPMKSFLVTSLGTFTGIVAADHDSRGYENEHNAAYQWYENREERLRANEMRGLSFTDRAVALLHREKYKIVSATWIVSMVGSFVHVGRNPHLSGQQKLVQARVYAQGLTLGVLCASAAFEISDQRYGRGLLDSKKKAGVADEAPTREGRQSEADLWKDMVAAEEQRLNNKQRSLYKHHQEQQGPSASTEEKTADSEDAKSKDTKPPEKGHSKSAKSDDKQKNTESLNKKRRPH